MVGLGNIRSFHRKLKASSLVEVLIAMVILLSVFAMGMLIFANLTKSSLSQQNKAIKLHMDHIRHQVYVGEELKNPVIIGDMAYYIEEQYLPTFQDRKQVAIFAERLADGQVIDSLVSIEETDFLNHRKIYGYPTP